MYVGAYRFTYGSMGVQRGTGKTNDNYNRGSSTKV